LLYLDFGTITGKTRVKRTKWSYIAIGQLNTVTVLCSPGY